MGVWEFTTNDMGEGKMVGFRIGKMETRDMFGFGTEGIGKDCDNNVTVMGTQMNNGVGAFSTKVKFQHFNSNPKGAEFDMDIGFVFHQPKLSCICLQTTPHTTKINGQEFSNLLGAEKMELF